MTKDKNYGLYVVFGVAVVAILAMGIVGGGITGLAGGDWWTNTRNTNSCSDTEPDENIYVYGEVKMEHRLGTEVKPDECLSDEKHLKQYFCSRPNRMGSKSYFCSNGCAKGVCLR